MTSLPDSAWVWELLLRGAVGGVLVFHVVHLVLPGPRPAASEAEVRLVELQTALTALVQTVFQFAHELYSNDPCIVVG